MELMEKIVNVCKRRGFIFPGSEIYGGLANTWDYGPLGIELKNRVKQLWWKMFVQGRQDVVGLESAILMNPKVWEASGHVAGFNDALVDCKKCKMRLRADHLIEDSLEMSTAGMTIEQMGKLIQEKGIKCPHCGGKEFTDARQFNLLFKTAIGVVEDAKNTVYLRGETAQGMFVNFKNVVQTDRKKLPFGIAQQGKAFRNEITPGNFIFRTIEFEQMEIEYFLDPSSDWKAIFEQWQSDMEAWLQMIGIRKENYTWREHSAEELSHYSKRTADVEFKFPFGQKELYGLAYRTDFDLTQHQKFSGQDLTYFDEKQKKKFIPHVIEPTFGVERTILALLTQAYTEEEVEGETRIVLKFDKKIAPIQVALLPLSKKEELNAVAMEIWNDLKTDFVCTYDETQSIGKRYRRQDEIGTPYCVTIDFDSLEDKQVTVRDRDTMKQERVAIAELKTYLKAQYV